ncbi:sugar phosphate isomerase/epimerase family protein [Brevibacillus sp. B_LB10_24]|uniref:sugar phosphate isomerase/epimerase family protein n=1 Tax=Brevibacillus sp. B_LB10_24 TaxID=3380645 RepID=UPI0038B82052
MKLAYMYATPDVTHSHVTAIQGEMSATLQRIKDCGYTGVELLVRDPRQFDQSRLVRLVADIGLDVPAICTGEVYGEDQVSFADPNAQIRQEAIDRMIACMELAEQFGAMVNVGRLRGRFTPEVPSTQTLDWMRTAIVQCAQRYPAVPIVIEPVNRQYANCLLNTPETLQFISEINLPNVGIMLDLVHMQVEQEEPAESMREAKPYFWHFHICDSDRLPVGLGTYDIVPVFQALHSVGFERYVTVESFQQEDAVQSMRQSYEALTPFFR